MTNWKQQIETAAFDLTNLEINTIISAEMTTAKTPARPRELLHQLAIKYDEKLNELINVYNLETESTVGKNETDKLIHKNALNGIIRKSGYYSFEELRQRAIYIDKLIQASSSSVDRTEDDVNSDISMINRIQRNCQEIMDILYQTDTFIVKDTQKNLGNRKSIILDTFEGILPEAEKTKVNDILYEAESDGENPLLTKKLFSLGDLSLGIIRFRDSKTKNNRDRNDIDLDLYQLMVLKKAFDIGTSKVVLQTIIGLDGDITNRIARSFADNPIPWVNELHHDSIRLSVNYWKNLIDALTKFGEYIIGLFANK